ncbi:hypothetical protein Tco_0947694 [Tanacetum coccineum]
MEPDVIKPAVGQLAIRQLVVSQPAFKQPAVGQLAIRQLAVSQPAVRQPAVNQPAVRQLAMSQQAVRQLASEEYQGSNLHARHGKEEIRNRSGNALAENVCKLIIRFHDSRVQPTSIFHLLSDKMFAICRCVLSEKCLVVVTAKAIALLLSQYRRKFL